MPSGQRLPQHHADCPDVRSRGRVAAGEPLGRDVRERSRDVARSGQRLGLRKPSQSEVEQPDRDALSVRHQDVRGLDIAVDDPASVSVRQTFEHLGSRLDGGRVVELPRAQELTKRSAGRVFVGDIDMPRIAAESIRALTARMPQPCGSFGLALGPRTRFALTRDDLERDVQTRCLVA